MAAEVTENEGSLAVPAVGKWCHVLHITSDAVQWSNTHTHTHCNSPLTSSMSHCPSRLQWILGPVIYPLNDHNCSPTTVAQKPVSPQWSRNVLNTFPITSSTSTEKMCSIWLWNECLSDQLLGPSSQSFHYSEWTHIHQLHIVVMHFMLLQ